MKFHIESSLKSFDEQNITDEQIMWELLNYEMRRFAKTFLKKNFEVN